MNTFSFIQRLQGIYGDRFDYSKIDYMGYNYKVCVICPEHGEFWQAPKVLLKGKGCPICNHEKGFVARRKTTEQFIQEAKQVHGDKYDYSNVEYQGSHKKVCIICPEHGEFYQSAIEHLHGSGCSKCGMIKVHKDQTKTTEQFIKECKEIWGEKYSYEHTVYNGALNKVTITCPLHGDFEILASDFLHKHGCQECSGTKKLTTEKFIEKAKKIHGNKYDYSKVDYINNKTKVCIICHKKDENGIEHGEFWQTPSRHLCGDKCPKCFKSYKKTTEQFIEEAKRIHGDKYDYSKVEYNGNKKKVCVICPEHGEFLQMPLSHLQGQGCKKCYEKIIGDRNRLSVSDFINRANNIHNSKYDYSKINYINTGIKICIICPEHGEFWQTPNKHLITQQGCPKCKQSHLERDTENILKELHINYESQKNFKWLGLKKLDFYLPDYDIAIECQGEQHFHPVKTYGGANSFKKQIERDIAKYNECKDNGVNLLYIINEKIDNSNDENFSGIYSKLYYADDLKEFLNSLKICLLTKRI